jgi:hypothetical protein
MRGDGTPNRAVIIGVVVFILVIGAIFFALSGRLFGPGEQEDRPLVTDITSSRSIRMTVDGPIVSNEERQAYRITVGYERRIVEGMKAYTHDVVATQTFDNNRTAYSEFAYALNRAGYDKRRNVKDEAADPRGVCPTGSRYTFELLDGGRVVDSAWTTSCNNTRGTMGTSGSSLKQLFDRQIPELTKVIKPVTLR